MKHAPFSLFRVSADGRSYRAEQKKRANAGKASLFGAEAKRGYESNRDTNEGCGWSPNGTDESLRMEKGKSVW